MKRLLCVIVSMFIGIAHADEININWMNGSTLYDTSTCTVGGDLNTPPAPQKYGYNFLGWVSFTPIEYIESDGTQYINTGILPNQDTRVLITFTPEGPQGTSWSPFGVYNSFWVTTNSSGTQIKPVYNGNSVSVWFYFSFNTKYTMDFNKNKFTVYDSSNQGVWWNTASEGTFTSATPMYIFRASNVNVGLAQMKLYSAKIWDNDELVRNFIPVLDGNGVACLYDLVSNEYFYNAGTGDFIAGPELTE